MLRVLPTTFKPVLQQISLSQVAKTLTYDWIQLRRSRAIDVSYVTCFKTKIALGRLNAQNVQILMQNVELFITFCNNLLFDSWMVKRATSLFNSFCSNVTK